MLSVTELMIHPSENKSPQKLLWTVIFFVSRQVRPGASEQYHVWVSKVRTRDLLGFDCPSVKNHIFKGVERNYIPRSLRCWTQIPRAGRLTTAAQFILWVKRKEFQNVCFTVRFTACHLNKPIPKKVMDDAKNHLFENMLRRNLQALNILKLSLWSKQNYNKNDQQWRKKKKVKLEKEDSKIWLNSTAPPSVKNCSYLPLRFLSNCREIESLDFLCNTLLL